MDIARMGDEGMSFERVLRLVEQLPDDSRTKQKLFGFKPFTTTQLLLADLFDIEAIGVWQRANANAKKHQQSPRPKPYPRPGAHLVVEAKEKDLRTLRQKLLDQRERLGIKSKKV